MKKFFLSLVVVAGFSVYAWRARMAPAQVHAPTESTGSNGSTSDSTNVNSAQPVATTQPSISSSGEDDGGSGVSNPATTPAAGSSAATTPTPTASSPTTSSGQYHDGRYIGSVADAFYGNVQVRVTVSGGKITDVAFLQYPNDRNTSVMINSQAMPMLRQEAIQAQSANVSGVSGATATSQAFVESLSSALSQA